MTRPTGLTLQDLNPGDVFFTPDGLFAGVLTNLTLLQPSGKESMVVGLEGGNISALAVTTPVKLLALLAPPVAHGDPVDLGDLNDPPWIVSTWKDGEQVAGYGLEASGTNVTRPGAFYLYADAMRAALAVNQTHQIDLSQSRGCVAQESLRGVLDLLCETQCTCMIPGLNLNPDDHAEGCPYADLLWRISDKLDHRAIGLILLW